MTAGKDLEPAGDDRHDEQSDGEEEDEQVRHGRRDEKMAAANGDAVKENDAHGVFKNGKRERAEKSIVASSKPPSASRWARNARNSSTNAPDCPGTANSRYSRSVASKRASSITCDSAISTRISSGMSESSA